MSYVGFCVVKPQTPGEGSYSQWGQNHYREGPRQTSSVLTMQEKARHKEAFNARTNLLVPTLAIGTRNTGIGFKGGNKSSLAQYRGLSLQKAGTR